MPDVKNKSWKDSLKTRRYEEHKHCIVCGRAVPIERDFCTQDCKDSYSKADKKKGKSSKIQIAVLVVVMIFTMLVVPRLLA